MTKDMAKVKQFILAGNFVKAKKLVEEVAKANKNNIDVLYAQAELQIHQKQWILALYSLDQILAIADYPEDSIWKLNEIAVRNKKVEIYRFLEQDKEVMEECQKILNCDSQNLLARYELGKKLFDLKNYKVAKEYLSPLVEGVSNRNDGNRYREVVLEMLFDIAMIEKKYPRARERMEQLLEALKKPVCRVFHKQAKMLYYIEQYSESLKVMNGIDSIYQWPLDLKLLEVIICYQLYSQGLNIQKYIDLPTSSTNEEVEQVVLDKFKALLAVYLDEEVELVKQARYDYAQLLVYRRMWVKAIEQMKFIADIDENYLDNSYRLQICEKIYNDSEISQFLQFHFDEEYVRESLKLVIENIISENYAWIHEDIWVLNNKPSMLPTAVLYSFLKVKSNVKLFVVFSVAHNFRVEDLDEILSNVRFAENMQHDVTVLSLFPIEIQKLERKNQFNELNIYYGEKLLNIFSSLEKGLNKLMHEGMKQKKTRRK